MDVPRYAHYLKNIDGFRVRDEKPQFPSPLAGKTRFRSRDFKDVQPSLGPVEAGSGLEQLQAIRGFNPQRAVVLPVGALQQNRSQCVVSRQVAHW